jgi:F0F1-type ATP synthase assembly protein I
VKNKPRKAIDKYLKYSGMALQMGAILFVGAWIGQKLDAYFGTAKPYFTIFCIILLFFGYLYTLVRELSKKEDE